MIKGKKSKNKGFNSFFQGRLRSFKNAFSGIAVLIKNEYNARIHLTVLIIAIIAGVLLKISSAEWLAVVFAAGLVFASECFNTALEYIADKVSSDYSNKIRKAKDVAAAGVLISAIVSVAVGLIIFIPRIIGLITR